MKLEHKQQLAACHLYAAIILVHGEMDKNKQKPGEEAWHTYYRDDLLDRVISAWVQVTRMREDFFPWRESVVIDSFIAFRKMKSEDKQKAREEYLL